MNSAMRHTARAAIFLTLFPVLSFSKSDLDERVDQYLEKIEGLYPLKKWSESLDDLKIELDKKRKSFYANPSAGVEDLSYGKLQKQAAEIKALRRYRKPIHQVMEQLQSDKVIEESFPKSMRVNSVEEVRERTRLVVSIKSGEKERLREKKLLLMKIDLLQQQFAEFQADWMFYYARKSLFKSVRRKFESLHYTQNGKAFQQYEKAFQQYLNLLKENPAKALKGMKTLEPLTEKPMEDLIKLKKQLTPNMIYASILEAAAEDGVDFTLKAEEKIESILQMLSDKNTKAVTMRLKQWENFKQDIATGLDLGRELKGRHKERMARKNQIANHVAALTEGSGNGVALDKDIDKALKVKAGRMKKSKVSSGRKKLKVEVDSFSDTLAHVDDLKFSVEHRRANFNKIYGEEKASRGLYTFVADGGRADGKDLKRFIDEVSLLSFGSSREFLSYQTPRDWKPSQPISWQSMKHREEKNHDREYSYVELFTEAHRKGQKKYELYEEQVEYIPANTLIIFNARGRVKRFETFRNIRNLRIRKNDLDRGTLYYKFLNYSTYGSEIYLNGIDHEIKIATPG